MAAEHFSSNSRFSRQIGHFPPCISLPADFNLHDRNARTEVRCTFSRNFLHKSGGFSKMAKAATKPPTKTEVFTSIADATGVSKRDVAAVFEALNDQIKKALSGRGGSRNFTIHGLCKIVVQHKPATKERQGVNPFTGEPTTFKAKPARNVVKVRPLKKLKDMVS